MASHDMRQKGLVAWWSYEASVPAQLFLFFGRHVGFVLGCLHLVFVLFGQDPHLFELLVAVVAVVGAAKEPTRDDERADDGESDDGRAGEAEVENGRGGWGGLRTSDGDGNDRRGALVGVGGGVGEGGEVVSLLVGDGGLCAGGVGAAGVGVVVDFTVGQDVGDLGVTSWRGQRVER